MPYNGSDRYREKNRLYVKLDAEAINKPMNWKVAPLERKEGLSEKKALPPAHIFGPDKILCAFRPVLRFALEATELVKCRPLDRVRDIRFTGSNRRSRFSRGNFATMF